MQDYIFFVSAPKCQRNGSWQFSVGSSSLKVHGPFPTREAALQAQRVLLLRWRARARSVGGELRVLGQGEWVVRVPHGTPVEGLRWYPDRGIERKGRDPRDDPPLLRRGPWKER